MVIQHSKPVRLPAALVAACRRWHVLPTRHVLLVQCRTQTMFWFTKAREQNASAAWMPPHRKTGPAAGHINTPLQRGGSRLAGTANRFHGFHPVQETVETVEVHRTLPDTPLKRGVNERGLPRQTSQAEVSTLGAFPPYQARARFRISTSRFGLGQIADSNRTPLGLHRIAAKIGGGWPIGTVFKGRVPIGFTWLGLPEASIVHRILWLEGLEPGFNRGGNVDSYRRYIYVHGFPDETTLGRPASCGCIHLAAADLLPLFQQIPQGTLLWICE